MPTEGMTGRCKEVPLLARGGRVSRHGALGVGYGRGRSARCFEPDLRGVRALQEGAGRDAESVGAGAQADDAVAALGVLNAGVHRVGHRAAEDGDAAS